MVCLFQGHIKSSSFRESDHMHKIKLGTFILSFPLLSARTVFISLDLLNHNYIHFIILFTNKTGFAASHAADAAQSTPKVQSDDANARLHSVIAAGNEFHTTHLTQLGAWSLSSTFEEKVK